MTQYLLSSWVEKVFDANMQSMDCEIPSIHDEVKNEQKDSFYTSLSNDTVEKYGNVVTLVIYLCGLTSCARDGYIDISPTFCFAQKDREFRHNTMKQLKTIDTKYAKKAYDKLYPENKEDTYIYKMCIIIHCILTQCINPDVFDEVNKKQLLCTLDENGRISQNCDHPFEKVLQKIDPEMNVKRIDMFFNRNTYSKKTWNNRKYSFSESEFEKLQLIKKYFYMLPIDHINQVLKDRKKSFSIKIEKSMVWLVKK